MNENEKRPLFELAASELEEELLGMFKAYSASHPIRCHVAAALMAAEATTQRLALGVFEQADATGEMGSPNYDALGGIFETVETLNRFLLEGRPCRIDLVLWDATGYIHGWFLNERGQPDTHLGSCPEVVARLVAALQALAVYEKDWRPSLERYATSLVSLVRLAREKAEIQARARVESQNWLRKLLSPTSLDRELLSLGFR